MRSTDGGLHWESTRDLITDTTTFPFPATRSFLVSNPRGLLLFFEGGIDGSGISPIFMMKSNDRGDTWSNAAAITVQNGYVQNVAVLGDTIAIVGYVEPIENDWIISSTDGGVKWTLAEFPFYTNDPRVALSNGWLHLAYTYIMSGCSFEQWYRRSCDLGVTWSDSVLLSTCDNKSGSATAIATTPDGNIYVSWTDSKYGCMGLAGCSILFRRSPDNGSTWLNEQTLTTTTWGNISKLASLGQYVFATWAGGSGTESRLSTNMGTDWASVCTMVDTGGYASNALSSNRSFVAWERSRNAFFIVSIRAGTLPVVGVEDPPSIPPPLFEAYDPFPNPFNSSTTIKYRLSQMALVRVELYNILGQSVVIMNEGEQLAGEHDLQWEADEQSSGVYIYRITAGKYMHTGKILLLR